MEEKRKNGQSKIQTAKMQGVSKKEHQHEIKDLVAEILCVFCLIVYKYELMLCIPVLGRAQLQLQVHSQALFVVFVKCRRFDLFSKQLILPMRVYKLILNILCSNWTTTTDRLLNIVACLAHEGGGIR